MKVPSPHDGCRRAACLGALLALLGPAHAAAPVAPAPATALHSLREWHEQDGLPADEVAGVAQDEAGFLWVASALELARFDGTAFERRPTPVEIHGRGLTRLHGAPAVPAVRNTTIRESGVLVLQHGAWRFEAEPALGDRPPRSVFGSADGARWIGCEDGTVVRRIGDVVTRFDPPETPGRKLPAFASDSTGTVWVARGNRLARFDGSGLSPVAVPGNEPELRIASSAPGGIWVVGRTTLWRWRDDALEPVMRLPDLAGAHFVQAALEDRHGHLWLATRSQGLFRIAGSTIDRVAASSDDVVSICEDGEGNLWAATNGGGLSRLRRKAHQLFDESSGLRDNFSYTVVQDRTGAMWLANRDGGAARIKEGKLEVMTRRPGWRSFSTMSMYPADDHVWITTGIGIFRASTTTDEPAVRVAALGNFRNVRVSLVARNGDYWIVVDPDRVARCRQDQVTLFGSSEGFDGRDVRALAEDDAGRIWLGAADGRLFRSVGERFERVPFAGADDCGPIQVIRFTDDRSMMLGTTRRGVVLVPQGDFAQVRALDDSHGLPGSNISQVLIDDHDRHWFASRIGIFWVHGKEVREFAERRVDHVHAILLGKDDGVPYLSCLGLFQPAAWKASDGTLWFATRRGVLRTDPSAMGSPKLTPPPIAITSIACDGAPLPVQPEVHIRSTVRKIQITLSALNLSSPESTQVRYRLEGFDNDWVVLGRDRAVTYPRLPPGRYVFSTMASIGSGSWSSQPAQITFQVHPPWWQSVAAQVSYLVVLVALVVAAVRKWSHRRLRLRLERAERARAIEQERARIARNIHDDVGASLTRISLLTQAAQQESTAPSPTLEKIYDATRAITRAMDEIVWAVNPRHDNTESLVYYIGNYAQSLLGAAGIRCRLESPDRLPELVLTSQIRHHLFLGCKEALNNVVKHARATEVTVRISVERETLRITISDNGRGGVQSSVRAAEASAPLVPAGASAGGASPAGGASNRPVIEAAAHRGAGGNGLRNMRERMIEIGGTCELVSAPGQGTTITFTVPAGGPPNAGLAAD